MSDSPSPDASTNIRDLLADLVHPSLLYVDIIDDGGENLADRAILGTISRCGEAPFVVYDREKLIQALMANQSEPEDDDSQTPYEIALEHFQFNIAGAWVGPHTPGFLDPITDYGLGEYEDQGRVWVVGETTPGYPAEWELTGVFDREEDALAACVSANHFLSPIPRNESAPRERTPFPNAVYPLDVEPTWHPNLPRCLQPAYQRPEEGALAIALNRLQARLAEPECATLPLSERLAAETLQQELRDILLAVGRLNDRIREQR